MNGMRAMAEAKDMTCREEVEDASSDIIDIADEAVKVVNSSELTCTRTRAQAAGRLLKLLSNALLEDVGFDAHVLLLHLCAAITVACTVAHHQHCSFDENICTISSTTLHDFWSEFILCDK